jgi:pimeloyl-ACP methyl ester carboxylesterase
MGAVKEHRGEVAGMPAFWLAAPGAGTPILYLHGVPTSADGWAPFLERTGGIAPDLPGFGRTGKGGHFPYEIAGYDSWLEAFLAELGVERFRLVAHDWGAVGLALAQRFPERVERLVLIDAVPLLPGHRWHRIARLWSTRVVGEVVMGLTARPTFAFSARQLAGPHGVPPPAVADEVFRHFDHGTQRAILRLYRSAPPEALARAGARLGDVRAPALVLWGEHDPYLGSELAGAYAAALPGARAEIVPGAGHWPWLDDPGVVERVAAFLAGANGSG